MTDKRKTPRRRASDGREEWFKRQDEPAVPLDSVLADLALAALLARFKNLDSDDVGCKRVG